VFYQVRKKIGDVRYTLPPDILGPSFNDEFGDVFGSVYAFTGDGLSMRQLRDYVEQVRAEILASRALVLPSFAEGLPVVIMEAMALRRPVLATFIAGNAELVRPGVDGWLVPAGDVQALADAIETCLETPLPILARMGDDAHDRVVARHSIAVEARKLVDLFREQAMRAAAIP